MILLIRRLPAITFSTADESGRLDGVSRRLCARYAALITNARMRPSIGPLPNRRARAAAACAVACSRPEASRASISLRSGVPSQKPTAASRGDGVLLFSLTASIAISAKPAARNCSPDLLHIVVAMRSARHETRWIIRKDHRQRLRDH